MKNQKNLSMFLGAFLIVLVLLLGIWAVSTEDLTLETKSEDEIEADILEQLALDTRVDPADVNVEVVNDTAVLTGNVDSYTEYRAAVNNALSVSGIDVVDDNLVISYEFVDIDTSDSVLEEVIEDRFFYNPDLESFDISVEVNEGVATLSGEVDAFWKKIEAGTVAFEVIGVVNVENNLAVVPSEDIGDEIIAENIVTSLENNIFIDAEDITVNVSNNIVTLTGTVETLYEEDTAVEIASAVEGVIDVENKIAVL
jgi:osmotically-inducible protein OsmY